MCVTSGEERDDGEDAACAGTPSCSEDVACDDTGAQRDLPNVAGGDEYRVDSVEGAEREERFVRGMLAADEGSVQLQVRHDQGRHDDIAVHNHDLHAVTHRHEQHEQHEHVHEELKTDEGAAHEDVAQPQTHHSVGENDEVEIDDHDLHARTRNHEQCAEQQQLDQHYKQQQQQQHEQQCEQQQQPASGAAS